MGLSEEKIIIAYFLNISSSINCYLECTACRCYMDMYQLHAPPYLKKKLHRKIQTFKTTDTTSNPQQSMQVEDNIIVSLPLRYQRTLSLSAKCPSENKTSLYMANMTTPLHNKLLPRIRIFTIVWLSANFLSNLSI